MKKTDVPAVIYEVGELKAIFIAVKDVRLKIMRQDPFPAGPRALSAPCLTRDLAFAAAGALEILEREFKDVPYIGLPAVPSELSKPSDPSLKPFIAHYVANECRAMTTEEAKQHPEALRFLPVLQVS